MQSSTLSWDRGTLQSRGAELALVLLLGLSAYSVFIKDYTAFIYVPFAFYFLLRFRISLDLKFLRFDLRPAHAAWLKIYIWGASIILLSQILTTASIPVLLKHSAAYKAYFDGYAKAFIGQNYWTTTFVMIFLAPWLEEVFFRGFLQRLLTKMSPIIGIVLPALIFAFLHVNVLGAMVIGLVFGIIAHRTKSLVLPIALHFANNFTCAFLQDSRQSNTPLFDQMMAMKFQDYFSLFLALATGTALVGFILHNYLQRTSEPSRSMPNAKAPDQKLMPIWNI